MHIRHTSIGFLFSTMRHALRFHMHVLFDATFDVWLNDITLTSRHALGFNMHIFMEAPLGVLPNDMASYLQKVGLAFVFRLCKKIKINIMNASAIQSKIFLMQ